MSLTHERLRSLLKFDVETGEFSWLTLTSARSNRQPFKGCASNNGYLKIRVDKKLYYAHRLAWFYVYGEWPKLLDHINRDRTDNRMSNLRLATRAENAMNVGLLKNNTSGVKGVSWCNTYKVWKAFIGVNGEIVILGSYRDKSLAIESRKRAERVFYREFASGCGALT